MAVVAVWKRSNREGLDGYFERAEAILVDSFYIKFYDKARKLFDVVQNVRACSSC